MKCIIDYFYPKKEVSYLEDLIVRFFIYQAMVGFILLIILIAQNLITQNENYLVSAISEFGLATFLIISLYILKFKGVTYSGNIFHIVMVGIILIAMNTLNKDISVLYKYLHGFYTVTAFLVGGSLFASRIVILINAILIFATTTRIYFYAIDIYPESSNLLTHGYVYHTVSLLIITVILFFIKKFTQQTIKKINSEAEIINLQNEKLSRSEASLSQLNKSKDKFLSIIAHDLKSPLASIISATNLLSDNFDDYKADVKKKYINMLHQSSQNTYDLLDNLLVWARSQQGLIEYRPKRENLYSIISEVLMSVELMAIDKNIRIENNTPQNLFVNVDRNMTQTIYRNIISNAIKFTPDNGYIMLGEESYTENAEQVHVFVNDSGIGISKDKVDQLFSIEDKDITIGTRGESGTGLGLNIANDFVVKHGGKIWVKSELGHGSSFNFLLPRF